MSEEKHVNETFEIKFSKKDTFTDNAYVTLVMKDLKFIVGAITLAKSLKTNDAKYDIVCMVTKDIDEKYVSLLKHFYDVIIEVPYLKYKSVPLFSDKSRKRYESWIQASYSKWNCLNLSMYKKVIFIDADIIMLDNVDNIFKMNAPAATFGSIWTKDYCYIDTDKIKPHVNKAAKDEIINALNNPSIITKEFCKVYENTLEKALPLFENFDHNDHVPNGLIEFALNNNISVMSCSFVLLEPNSKHYILFKKHIEDIVETNGAFGYKYTYSGTDEQSILSFYLSLNDIKWTFIGREYNCIPWHLSWIRNKKPKLFHYFNIKPWLMQLNSWPDLLPWQIILKNSYDKLTKSEKKAMQELVVFDLEENNTFINDCCYCKKKDHPFMNKSEKIVCPKYK